MKKNLLDKVEVFYWFILTKWFIMNSKNKLSDLCYEMINLQLGEIIFFRFQNVWDNFFLHKCKKIVKVDYLLDNSKFFQWGAWLKDPHFLDDLSFLEKNAVVLKYFLEMLNNIILGKPKRECPYMSIQYVVGFCKNSSGNAIAYVMFPPKGEKDLNRAIRESSGRIF